MTQQYQPPQPSPHQPPYGQQPQYGQQPAYGHYGSYPPPPTLETLAAVMMEPRH